MLNQTSLMTMAGILALSAVTSQASAECLTAIGKIANNAQTDGSTMGIASIKLGRQKLKCGIIGIPQENAPPNFKHTLVCDDRASDGEAQAQITFNTSFLSEPTFTGYCPEGSPGGLVSFTFEEIAIPDPATARGAFQDAASDGALYIVGDFNCDGGINMEFEGEMCFAD